MSFAIQLCLAMGLNNCHQIEWTCIANKIEDRYYAVHYCDDNKGDTNFKCKSRIAELECHNQMIQIMVNKIRFGK